MQRALREHPRMVAARVLALIVAFFVGFGIKGATSGEDSKPSAGDNAKLTAAQGRARTAARELRTTRVQLDRANARLRAAARRDAAGRRTQARLRAQSRRLRRALRRPRR
jgi:hypothetical protein